MLWLYSNANCSTGHYCCKKRQWYVGEFGVCSEHCIGKSCSTSDDCGGPGETCNSYHRCAFNQNSNTASNSLPSWMIAVITVSLVVFLITVGLVLAVFWYVKKKRPANATQAGTVPQQSHNPSHYIPSRIPEWITSHPKPRSCNPKSSKKSTSGERKSWIRYKSFSNLRGSSTKTK